MKNAHLTIELLDALVALELPPEVLSHLTWKHLMALCPTCKEVFDEWTSRTASGSYQTVLDRTIEAAVETEREHKALEKKISIEFNELLRTPKEERQGKLQRANKRFVHPLLIERFLEKGRGQLSDNPSDALHFVGLAVTVAKRCTLPSAGAYKALAQAHFGNALRATGDLPGAAAAFRKVRETIRSEDVMDCEVYADVDRLEGSVKMDQRDFESASTLFSRAVLVYRLLRQDLDAARVLLNLTYVYSRLKKSVKALEAIHEAIEIIDPDEELELACAARQTLASTLCDMGDSEGALKVLEQARSYFRRFLQERDSPRRAVCLITWLEGRVARGLEAFDEAEDKLQEAAEGYGSLGIGYDTALVCLDLADTYLAQGKHQQVAKLAKETEKLLAANDLTQEATAALLLFQQSAAQEVLSTEVIARLRRRIEEKGLKRGAMVN